VLLENVPGSYSPVAEEHIHEVNKRLKELFTGKQ